MARLQAEAAAQDAAQRLQVAQQQMAEYATGKAADANRLIQQGQQLSDLLKKLAAAFTDPASRPTDVADSAASGETMSSALAALSVLQERLGESAEEAAAFAQIQQGADADSLKRSPEEVADAEPGHMQLHHACMLSWHLRCLACLHNQQFHLDTIARLQNGFALSRAGNAGL